MRRVDLLTGVGLLLLAGLYYQQSFLIVRGFAADRLGPAAFPRLLALLLAACAVALMVRAWSGRSAPAPPPPLRRGVLGAVVALLVAYGLFLPTLGFLLATPALLGTVAWLLGLRPVSTVATAAVGMTLALYAVFGRLLHVLLPLGPLGGR